MFIVLELQTNGGKTGNFTFAFDNLADAYAKYYTILAAAATVMDWAISGDNLEVQA